MSLTDKEYYQLTISIQKALSAVELPLKMKHARAAIIGTFQTQGAQSFWAVAIRQPLQENRIKAWKFCHLLHKVLRDGHPLCCQHSLRQKSMLIELGKLWGHLTDGYGLCIRQYTQLLVTKLGFHERNPRFPGSLVLKRGELEQIGGNDINFYFQMAVEMFDYLDDIIGLQATIFNSLTSCHGNSMTAAGQCRLAPLIPCIQDSNQLYDFTARIMFKLHSNLPNDVLTGHRDRFRVIFNQLKTFYERSRNLQYFVNLISVPSLPENAPNFSSHVDFGTYTAPVVVIPEQQDTDTESIVDNLVDTTALPSPVHEQAFVQASPPPSLTQAQNLDRLLLERDDLIRQLQMEIERLGKYIRSMTTENREQQARLGEQIATLNSELSATQEKLTNMRFEKEELELKAQSAPTLEQKVLEEEEKAKTREVKLEKLKVMYTQIRDEHVKLLRQHGEVTKHLASSTRTVAEAIASKEEFKIQLEELQQTQSHVKESLQQSSNETRREKEQLQQQLHEITAERIDLIEKHSIAEANRRAEIAELQLAIENLRQEAKNAEAVNIQLADLRAEHGTLVTECETLRTNHDNRQLELVKLQDEIIQTEKAIESKASQKILEISSRTSSIEAEKEEALVKLKVTTETLAEKVDEIEKNRATFEDEDREKTNQIVELKEQLIAAELKFKNVNVNVDRVSHEKACAESDVLDLLHQQEQLDERLTTANETIEQLKMTLDDAKIRSKSSIQTLLEACTKASENLAMRSIDENATEFVSTAGTPNHFLIVTDELQEILTELEITQKGYTNETASVEALAPKIIIAGHLIATVYVQGMTICNKSTDIECGEKIVAEIKEWCKSIVSLFETLMLNSADSQLIQMSVSSVKNKLELITRMVREMSNRADPTAQIEDLVECELSSMDKAIEEAAAKIEAMLSSTRASDSGIKLEVNEKILDACTNLMKCIRLLVQKSRLLQAEIVVLGKGSASAKEFYKRNHQWTEGLISAAKSVAQGANFLVTAANKSVTGDSSHQLDLVVAAQEIAACTAQLVVASRVKAPRNSQNLSALGQASREVTQATGAVVATAKDCSNRLEESQDYDLTGLTLHQAKTLEMEIQVKVLELEQALQVERMRLAAFRRKNYQGK